MTLAEALAVASVARNPVARATAPTYRVLADMAPAIVADGGPDIMRLDIAAAAIEASKWAAKRELSDDLAITLALAMPRQAPEKVA